VPSLSVLVPLTIVGIVMGAMYALPAMGIVLIYKTSRVLNFAHGAMGMFSTFVAYQLGVVWHLPVWLAVLGALVFAALLGLVIERFTIRPLEGKPPLVKVVVTLGWMLILMSVAGFIWGANAYHIPLKVAPEGTVRFPMVNISYLQLTNLGVALVLTAGLAFFFKATRLGIAMRAVADNTRAARILGVRVELINCVSWMLGSVLAAIAGILLSPMVNLDTVQLTMLVLSAFAAALVGGLVSLPATFAVSIGLGILHSDIVIWAKASGVRELVTLGVILVALFWRGGGLAKVMEAGTGQRSAARFASRKVSTARVTGALAVVVALAALLPLAMGRFYSFLLAQTLVYAVALFGLMIVVGLLGQPSLMHAELMGLGAGITATLVAVCHLNFWVAGLLAVLAGYLAGIVVGLPALRIRGLALAIVTLAIARVFDSLVLPSKLLASGVGGRTVARPSLGPISLAGDRAYYEVALAVFALAALAALAVRRGKLGRVLRSIRESERGAAASGVPVTRYKLLGFATSAAFASLAGVISVGLTGSFTPAPFDWTHSVILLAMLVIMGSTAASGAVLGAVVLIVLPEFSGGNEYVEQLTQAISGAALIIQSIAVPQGLVPSVGAAVRRIAGGFGRGGTSGPSSGSVSRSPGPVRRDAGENGEPVAGGTLAAPAKPGGHEMAATNRGDSVTPAAKPGSRAGERVS